MIGLVLPHDLSVLCLGAHPDDIEIGCGGTLIALAKTHRMSVTQVVATSTAERAAEAHAARDLFAPGADLHVLELPDGRLPLHWGELKELLEDLARTCRPDLIFTHRVDDAHQDHRAVAGIATTVWRDALVLRFEIPKWDGDVGQPTHYVALGRDVAMRKVAHLNAAFPSQKAHDWWDDDLFLGLMRFRGMECRDTHAEAFVVEKAIVS